MTLNKKLRKQVCDLPKAFIPEKLFIIFFFLCTVSHSQDVVPINQSDSIELVKIWAKYSSALIAGNKNSLVTLTQSTVDCLSCKFADSGSSQYVPADSLFNMLFRLLQTSTLGKKIKKTPNSVSALTYSDFQPPHSDLKPGQDFTIYQITFYVRPLKEDPTTARHQDEGAHIFQFIKKQGRFLLYGFDTAP